MLKNILVLDDGTEIAAGTVGQNAILSLAWTENVSSTTDLAPGAACANKIEAIIWVEPGNDLLITSGTRLRYYRVPGQGNRELAGTFWAVKPTRQSRNTYKIFAYDVISKLDGIQSAWLRDNQSMFPLTIWQFAQNVAARCGVTITNASLPRNGSYVVQAFYADNLTGRQLLAWAAEASGTFLRATPDGQLEFAWYDYADEWIGGTTADRQAIVRLVDDDTLFTHNDELFVVRVPTPYYYKGSLSYEDYMTKPIDKVQIKSTDEDVGAVYPPDETGTNAWVISGNLLLSPTDAETLASAAQALFPVLDGITYRPCTFTCKDDDTLGVGQIVEVIDAKGNRWQTYLMSAEHRSGRVKFTATGNASRDSTAAINSQFFENLQGKVFELSVGVDGLRATAKDLQGDYAQLELDIDGFRTEVSKELSDMTDYIDTETSQMKDEAVNDAVQQAVQQVDQKLNFYPTTSQMNSAIQQSASEINLSVSQKLTGYSTTSQMHNYVDGQLASYPTTVEMNSAIQQSASEINLSVTQKLTMYPTDSEMQSYVNQKTSQIQLTVNSISTEVSNVQGDMTNLEQTVDGLELTVVKDGEVRTAFAADSTSVTINSGIITFSGNTLVIQSTNFAMDAQGNVLAKGNFTSSNGIVGSGRNEASLTSGGVYAYRYPGNSSRMVARLDGYGEATAMGQLILYATQGGAEDAQAAITCQNIGARLALANGQGSTSIALNGAQGAGHFDGMLEVAGQGGLAVTRTITCQDLTAWGNKNRAVRTSYGTLKMAALETPEPTFADSGSARCGEDGTCYVEIEPRYAETVDRRRALQWLVTPTSPGAMWVEAVDSGAVMHGTPGQAFYWLCLGAQDGFSGEYAEPSEVDKPKSVDPAHGIMTDLEKIAETDIQQADALMDEEGALL